MNLLSIEHNFKLITHDLTLIYYLQTNLVTYSLACLSDLAYLLNPLALFLRSLLTLSSFARDAQLHSFCCSLARSLAFLFAKSNVSCDHVSVPFFFYRRTSSFLHSVKIFGPSHLRVCRKLSKRRAKLLCFVHIFLLWRLWGFVVGGGVLFLGGRIDGVGQG
jgi:hypothetical protein